MEKPDADGFVTVTWPSKNIPHGGIFHNRIANPSADQQQLLRVLLEESKLTIEQNQARLASRKEKEKRERELRKHQVPETPCSRPRTSRRRSLSEIRSSGVYEMEDYQPTQRGEDRELMKEKLANAMACGDDGEEQQKVSNILPKIKPKKVLPSKKDKWNDLVTQIRERTEWLAEMEYLGQAGPHRDIIKDQIAMRMRALDELGIDLSECSSARTHKSGFSTMRSTEPEKSPKLAGASPKLAAASPKLAAVSPKVASASEHSTRRSSRSVKKPSELGSGRSRNKEENVESYRQMTPLQYSPRRRQ